MDTPTEARARSLQPQSASEESLPLSSPHQVLTHQQQLLRRPFDVEIRAIGDRAAQRLNAARWTAALSVLPWAALPIFGLCFQLYNDFSGITMAVEDPRQVVASLLMWGLPLMLLLLWVIASLKAAFTAIPRSYAQTKELLDSPDGRSLFADDELIRTFQARLSHATRGWAPPQPFFSRLEDRVIFCAFHLDNLKRLRKNPESRLAGLWQHELARKLSPVFANLWFNISLGGGCN